MKPRHWAALVVIAVLVFPVAASATLMEADLAAPGDGLVTLDAGSGLAWLDLTMTVGLPYLDAKNLGAGLGFRVATLGEVSGLLSNAGLSRLNSPASLRCAGVPCDLGTPLELAPASTLIDLLGVTGTFYPFSFSTEAASLGWMLQALLADQTELLGSAGVGVGVEFVTPVPPPPTFPDLERVGSGFGLLDPAPGANPVRADHGTFLVRDASAPVIPEPSAALVFPIGMAIVAGSLGWRAHRRRALRADE